ncbi:MAG: hypothetical protein JNM84_08030 [Planctomycetes bacterium]|nr:hypothetical protein [Planctomycetota bacterium]
MSRITGALAGAMAAALAISSSAADTIPANPNGSLPFRAAVQHLAADMLQDYAAVDPRSATLHSIDADRKVIAIAGGFPYDLAPTDRHFVLRRHVLVRDAGFWAHVANLDFEVTLTPQKVQAYLEINWRKSGVDAAVSWPGLQQIRGWVFSKRWTARMGVDLVQIAEALTDPTQYAAAAQAHLGAIVSTECKWRVESPDGNYADADEGSGNWVTLTQQLDSAPLAGGSGVASDLTDCIADCAGEVGIVLGWVDVLTMGVGVAACAVGCTAGGPAWVACVSPCVGLVWTALQITIEIEIVVGLIACTIACL